MCIQSWRTRIVPWHSHVTRNCFSGDPGALVSPVFAESFAKTLKNLRVVKLGAGRHYLQEDHAQLIGATVNDWLIGLLGSSSEYKLTA